MFELYSTWDASQRERWQIILRGGKRRFVVRYGIGYWGVWCFLVVTTGLLFSLGQTEVSAGQVIGSNAVIFSLFGALFGHLVWESTSRSYERMAKSMAMNRAKAPGGSRS